MSGNAESGQAQSIPAWRMRGFSFAGHLKVLFEQYRVEAVVDVGANTGQYRDFLRTELAFHGPVLSYEPQPECFRQLLDRAAQDDNWHVRNLALGEQAGELALHLTQESQLSSFLAPAADGTADFSGMNAVREVIKVAVARLDDDLGLPTTPQALAGRLFLKLDTQGFNLNVLRGAPQTLARTVALQIELPIKPTYQGSPGYREVIDKLAQRGFELSSILPTSHDEALGLVEADGVFINRRVLERMNAAIRPSTDEPWSP